MRFCTSLTSPLSFTLTCKAILYRLDDGCQCVRKVAEQNNARKIAWDSAPMVCKVKVDRHFKALNRLKLRDEFRVPYHRRAEHIQRNRKGYNINNRYRCRKLQVILFNNQSENFLQDAQCENRIDEREHLRKSHPIKNRYICACFPEPENSEDSRHGIEKQ